MLKRLMFEPRIWENSNLSAVKAFGNQVLYTENPYSETLNEIVPLNLEIYFAGISRVIV